MALVKCSECGKEIGDKATFCVNCGNPIEYKIKCIECGERILKENVNCPYCGCPVDKGNNLANEKIDNYCLSGFIIGIISFFLDFVGLVSATGLTLSIIGFNTANNSKSKNFAIGGMITSGIELLLKFIQLINIINSL